MNDLLTGLRVAMIAIYALLAVRVVMHSAAGAEITEEMRRRGWSYMRLGLLCICAAVIAFYSPTDISRIAGLLGTEQVTLAFIVGSALMIVGGLVKIIAWDVADGRSERGLIFYSMIPVLAVFWAFVK